MDAKLLILTSANHFISLSGIEVTAGMASFCHLYNTGELTLPPETTTVISSVTPATLYRWRKTLNTHGTAALSGCYGNRKGDTRIQRQPEIHTFITAMLADHPHANAKHILDAIHARFSGSTSITLPRLRTLQRWLANWRSDNRQVHTAISNPGAWKNLHMAAFGFASEEITAANQLWEIDSTPTDVMLADGRHTIIGVIDVYSRRVKLLVSKTSRATAVASLLRLALLDWGVPEQIKTDNGSDYVSRHVRRALAGLGIEHFTCTPGAPWQKPHIERLFRTFSHGLIELLPGYIGHNVAERRAIDDRTNHKKHHDKELTAAELQTFCDSWTHGIYHNTPHGGLNGATPAQAADTAQGNTQIIENERALDVLLAEAPGDGIRTVTKQGIRIDGMTYIHAELGLHIGTQVRCLYDPHDVGRIVVFDTNPTGFVCVAECPEITGVSRQEIAIAAKQKQRQAIQKAKRNLRAAARKLDTKAIAQEILNYRTVQAQLSGNLTPLTTPHDSQGIQAATEAAQAYTTLLNTDDQPKDVPTYKPELPPDQRSRFHLWHRLNHRTHDGDTLTEQELNFLKHYPSTPEFRAEEHLHKAFHLPIPQIKSHLK
jgi:transposase InsO family protein